MRLLERFSRLAGGRGSMLCPSAVCGHRGRVLISAGASLCNTCHCALPARDGAAYPTRAVAVVGSERCGQTAWLIQALDGISRLAERYRFPLGGQEIEWESSLNSMSLGRPVMPTPALPGVAWCFDYAQKGACRRLYVCDINGCEVGDWRRLERYQILRSLDGLIVAVDPFGLVPVRRRYGAAVRDLRPPVAITTQSFGETRLANVLRALQTSRPVPQDGVWDIAVAVVVTKLDALGLWRRLGSGGSLDLAAADLACRGQLLEWGFDNMIRAFDLHFRKVCFFGYWQGAEGAFAAANPLLWMFEETVK